MVCWPQQDSTSGFSSSFYTNEICLVETLVHIYLIGPMLSCSLTIVVVVWRECVVLLIEPVSWLMQARIERSCLFLIVWERIRKWDVFFWSRSLDCIPMVTIHTAQHNHVFTTYDRLTITDMKSQLHSSSSSLQLHHARCTHLREESSCGRQICSGEYTCAMRESNHICTVPYWGYIREIDQCFPIGNPATTCSGFLTETTVTTEKKPQLDVNF